jgi:hypothetical protein
MDFPIATRIPSFDNSVWIHLPVCIITVEVKHRQPTQAIFRFCLQVPKSRVDILFCFFKAQWQIPMQSSPRTGSNFLRQLSDTSPCK